MKFGMRFLVVFSLLTGTGIGLYFVEAQARKPIILKIGNHIGIENEVDRPVHLIEFRSQHNVREVELASGGYLRSRLREVKRDFSRFDLDYSCADKLLEKYPMAMRKAAASGLEHDSLKAVVEAAATLERLDDARGIEALKQRLLEDCESDRPELWRMLGYFEKVQPEFEADEIERLTEIANSDLPIGDEAAFLLCKLDINAQPLQRHLLEGTVNADSLVWLLENSPSNLVLELAANKLAMPQRNFFFNSTELHRTVLELAREELRFVPLAHQAEANLNEYILKDRMDEWDQAKCWNLLEQYATARSVPFLESQLAECGSSKLFLRIIAMLERLGASGSAERNYRRRLKKTFESESKPYMSWDKNRMRDELLRIGPPILGPEETVELCIKASSKSLEEFVENTRDGEFVKLLKYDPPLLEAAREKAIEHLKMKSENVGGVHFSGFASNWYKNELSRQKAVDWINEKFAPSKKLTVDRVLTNERYSSDHSLWFTWSRFDGRVSDIHTFLITALAHSGHGNLAHWEDTHPEGVTDLIEEYAKVESKEFQVGSHDEDGSYPISFAINVNRRSYHFDVHEGPNGSDERYDVGAIVEIMNTIAIRQRLKRRFFIYETLPEAGFCLVMFMTPDLANELYAEFRLSPARGTDHYLEN